MGEWTPTLVEARLAEAADVLKRLPEERVRGCVSSWPAIVHDAADLRAQEPARLRRPPPSSAAITRMDEALQWLIWLEPVDAKILWLRASKKPWKSVCWIVGMARTAAHEHWLYGLCVLAWKLSGRSVPRNRSRRYVIEITRSSESEKERKVFANSLGPDKSAS
jgi:hypothetical protein